ncbi:MAG: hypothetical protein M5U34_40375 [Chloroflexi bacterium]|nr:hypothetical protein [Chloroflexota bacterium]
MKIFQAVPDEMFALLGMLAMGLSLSSSLLSPGAGRRRIGAVTGVLREQGDEGWIGGGGLRPVLLVVMVGDAEGEIPRYLLGRQVSVFISERDGNMKGDWFPLSPSRRILAINSFPDTN